MTRGHGDAEMGSGEKNGIEVSTYLSVYVKLEPVPEPESEPEYAVIPDTMK